MTFGRLSILCLLVAYIVFAVDLPDWVVHPIGGNSPAVRLEMRSGTGGRLVSDTWAVSPRGAEDVIGTVTIADKTIASPLSWNSTTVADGWKTVKLSTGSLTDSILVLNKSTVTIHGGRITASETWNNSTVHVLRNRVIVPNGKTLSITAGAIVKFCEDTQIVVESGGKLDVAGSASAPVQFAAMANDTVGGNTDMADKPLTINTYSISGSGTVTYNDYVRFHDVTTSNVPGWYSVSLTNCVVSESTGEALVRVTLSGSRGVPVNVKWRTIDDTATYGNDFTLNNGTITWDAKSSGMQYIRIPLVSDDVMEGDESFTVELYDELSAVVATRRCTVRIQDTGLHDEWTARDTAEDVYLDTRRDFGGMLAHGTVAIAVRGAGDNDKTPKINNKALSNPSAFNTTTLEDGWYPAQLPETPSLEENIAILNDSGVMIHGGRLAFDETWNSMKIHLVRNNVVVPNGVTLTITAGSIVKLCTLANIVVESGGKLVVNGTAENMVTFAHVTNDAVGGDTDMQAAESVPQNAWNITKEGGTLTMNQYVRVLDRTSLVDWYAFSLADCIVAEKDGQALVRLNLSGTRNVPVSVSWRAVAGTAQYGNDYTLASGTVTYGEKESGMKYITIPLVADSIPEGSENFTVELYDPCGAVITGSRCMVTIFDDELPAMTAHANAQDVYLDTRDTIGGRMARGSTYFSRIDEGAEGTVKLTKGGKTTTLPQATYDTTKLADGWYDATLGDVSMRIMILNDSAVTVHGGRLAANETWSSAKTHLVRNWVVIPNGKTLEITEGAVVKICPGAGFVIESGGTLKATGSTAANVVFTHVGDETIGESTALNGVTAANDEYGIENNGTFTVNDYAQIRWRTSVSGWYAISIADCVVAEKDGMALVRVSLAGSRGIPVTMQWRAIQGTATASSDYMKTSGSVTWGAKESGLKYIEIPLVADNVMEGSENFTVEMLGATAAVLATKKAASVTIYDQALEKCLGTAANSIDTYLDTRRDLGGMLAQGTIRISKTGDYNEISVPMLVTGEETQEPIANPENVNTKTWTNGWYDLSLDELGSIRTANIYVMNTDSVAVHGGRLSANETWDMSKLHLVRNNVVVPNGVTLNITEGAIVKFCSGSSLQTEAGGTINVTGSNMHNVLFMHVDNINYGSAVAAPYDPFGDKPELPTPPVDKYKLVTNGTFNANEYVRVYDVTSFYDWKKITLEDCVVSEYDGKARVRCTLSDKRNYPVKVNWRIHSDTPRAYGRDYTEPRGVLTWAANTSGMQYIEIDMVPDDVEQGPRSYQIELYDVSAALVSRGSATVTIYDVNPKMNEGWIEHDTEPIWTLDDRGYDFYNRIVPHETLVRYGSTWAETANGDCTVRLSYVPDGGEAVVFKTGKGEGWAVWNTDNLAESGYTLVHEILDKTGTVVDTQTARFNVLRDTILHEGGLVAENEIWTADKVHIVHGTIQVTSGRTLTIENGAIVKFMLDGNDGSKIWVVSGGTLNAEGVIFTHINDDSVGGDTNQDSDQTVPLYDCYSIDIINAEIIAEKCELRFRTFSIPAAINSNLTLAGGRTYRVTENTTLGNKATLTIGAGAVIKFNSGFGFTTAAGTKIITEGTYAQPVVFTSYRDDEFGGNTNRDAGATDPAGNDWKGLTINGTADLLHTRVRYGGSNGSLLALNGTSTLLNCRVEYSSGYAIAVNTTATIMNSLMANATTGLRLNGGTATLSNCVIDNCNYGFYANAGKGYVYNTIISDCHGSDETTGWALSLWNNASLEARFCNIWSELEGAGPLNTPTKITQEQLTYLNPMFRDSYNGDYNLRVGSRMVDAGSAAYAPALDFAGQARENDRRMADTGVGDENGVCPDLGMYELTGAAVESDIDLVVNWVRGPVTAMVGDDVTIRWQTVNVGTVSAMAPWTDIVGLESAESSLGAQVVELGEVTVESSLRPNGFKEFSATFTVPPVSEGDWRFRVALNQYRDVREGENEMNNIGVAEQIIRIRMPQLTAGENTVELPGGETTSYRLADLPTTGGLVVFRCARLLSIGGNAGFVSKDGKALWQAQKLQDGVWALAVPANQTQNVYVQLENLDAETAAVAIDYDDAAFSITAGDVREVPNKGTVTLTFMGTRLTPDMDLWLQNGSRKVEASRVIEGGDGVYWATFGLEGVTAGDYAVWAKRHDTGETCSAPALKVKKGGVGPEWWCELSGSSTARASRVASITFTYGNSGDMELPAPYVRFYNGNGATLRFSPDEDWQEEREFLAISGTYPYSILKPGETQSVTVYFTIPSNVFNASIRYSYTLDDDSPFPWEKTSAMRPDWADDEAWGHILAALKANIGETWNDFLDTMRADLDQLGALGYGGCRLDQLWQMEVNAALGADGGISTLAGGTDIARSGRGMGVAFSRSYSGQLFRRLRNGVLGRGWTHSYDYSCKMDDGQATFEINYPGGSTRTFTKTGSAWYAKQPDDKGQMAVNGNRVTITEKSGSYTVYDFDMQRPVLGGDNEGNTVALTWNGGRLTKVQHSDGQALTVSYSGGYISSVSDDKGRTARYAYENGNLTSVESFNGLVTRYSYHQYEHTPNSYALEQVEYPNGVKRIYEYDQWGRVAMTYLNDVRQAVEVRRDGVGVFSVIDADGAEATSYGGPYGEILLAVDPMGNQTRISYDQDTRQMLSIQTPTGKKVQMSYDADQNVNRVVNPAGFATEFTHEADFGSMTSFTDANGQSVKYGYDDKARPTSITYQDGSVEGWTYDEHGDARTWTNRRGMTVNCDYDNEGRLVKKTWPDGRVFQYTYNHLGNLTKVSDSETGAITIEYDSHEWVTKVTYPQNRWFTFTRDDVGRVMSRTAFDGHVLNVEYDDLGRAWRWTDKSGKAYRENVYDETVGRLIRTNNGNGTYTTYSYDVNSRMTAIVYHAANGTVFASFGYVYNADGQRVAMTTLNGTVRYVYDAAGQLTSATYEDNETDVFGYDPVGNRITANGVAYIKNNLNQYTKVGTDLLSYDADGNLTTWTNGDGTTVYEYDVLNRLVKVTRPDHSVWSCQYDAVGNRVRVTDRGRTRETVYFGGVYADVENGSVTKRYLGGIVENANGTTRYWHWDGLASVRAISNEKGSCVGKMDYNVAGNVISHKNGETTDFGFVGTADVRMDATGLLFMGNRYYSPELGRFIQTDPIGIEAGDVCFYRYCGNDGMNFIDPSGLSFSLCDLKSWHKGLEIISWIGTGLTVGGVVIAGVTSPTGVGPAVGGVIAAIGKGVSSGASGLNAAIYACEGDVGNAVANGVGAVADATVIGKGTAWVVNGTRRQIAKNSAKNAATFKTLEEGKKLTPIVETQKKMVKEACDKGKTTGTRLDIDSYNF